MTKILLDGDGSPVVFLTVAIAKQFGLPVILACDTAHVFREEQFDFELLTILTVGQGADAVDFALLNRLSNGDLCITQDYGLAALVLAKGGEALHPRGFFYTEQNIDGLLAQRYLNRSIRQAGGKMKGPKKRDAVADQRFQSALGHWCQRIVDKEE